MRIWLSIIELKYISPLLLFSNLIGLSPNRRTKGPFGGHWMKGFGAPWPQPWWRKSLQFVVPDLDFDGGGAGDVVLIDQAGLALFEGGQEGFDVLVRFGLAL